MSNVLTSLLARCLEGKVRCGLEKELEGVPVVQQDPSVIVSATPMPRDASHGALYRLFKVTLGFDKWCEGLNSNISLGINL